MTQCWIASIAALVPSTVMSRSRAPYDTVPAPSTSGVTRANARAARDRERVVERELARRLADEQPLDAAAGGLGAARQDDQELGAERRELPRDVAARAFADGRQQHDRRDADRDREQHHRRAQRVAPQRLQRHARDVERFHGFASRSSPTILPSRSVRWRRARPPIDGVVSHEQQRDAVAIQLLEDLHDLAAGARVEVARRLVGEQEARLHDDRAPDRDALALAARELIGPVVEARLEPDRLQDLRRRARAARAARRR